ncbi:competence type IV pilus minor pilin ComGF [Rossellomorea oryzaecorticis]|uniref:Competence type IV pilus minor pilin ComGF n=1 Tax=Rossellomorea oryzaecorticis TaxID=1396505 RepID=A0ABU9KD87_9BACI
MKFACLNNKGFTLLDAMLSFLVFSIISLGFPLVIKGFETIQKESVPPRYYEWNLFSQSLRTELRGGSNFLISSGAVSYVSRGETINYERYQDSIRRQVDERGHEVVLQGVDSFEISEVPQGIRIDVIFEEGEIVESEFYYYKEKAPQLP